MASDTNLAKPGQEQSNVVRTETPANGDGAGMSKDESGVVNVSDPSAGESRETGTHIRYTRQQRELGRQALNNIAKLSGWPNVVPRPDVDDWDTWFDILWPPDGSEMVKECYSFFVERWEQIHGPAFDLTRIECLVETLRVRYYHEVEGRDDTKSLVVDERELQLIAVTILAAGTLDEPDQTENPDGVELGPIMVRDLLRNVLPWRTRDSLKKIAEHYGMAILDLLFKLKARLDAKGPGYMDRFRQAHMERTRQGLA